MQVKQAEKERFRQRPLFEVAYWYFWTLFCKIFLFSV